MEKQNVVSLDAARRIEATRLRALEAERDNIARDYAALRLWYRTEAHGVLRPEGIQALYLALGTLGRLGISLGLDIPPR